MDNDILKILSEELRETKNLVIETRRIAEAAEKSAEAAMKRADASWELVVITRNQINRPWWKKLLGIHPGVATPGLARPGAGDPRNIN